MTDTDDLVEMTNRVVVTGVGMVTALGHSTASTWEQVLQGASGVDIARRFDHGDLPPQICIAAEVKDFSPAAVLDRKELRRVDLFIQYALVAADEALCRAGLGGLGTVPDPDETGVIVGSGVGGIGTILETAKLADERGSSPGAAAAFRAARGLSCHVGVQLRSHLRK